MSTILGGFVNASYSVSGGPVRGGVRTTDFDHLRAFFILGNVRLCDADFFELDCFAVVQHSTL